MARSQGGREKPRAGKRIWGVVELPHIGRSAGPRVACGRSDSLDVVGKRGSLRALYKRTCPGREDP